MFAIEHGIRILGNHNRNAVQIPAAEQA